MSGKFKIIPSWVDGHPCFYVAENIDSTSHYEYHRDQGIRNSPISFSSVQQAKDYIDQILATEQKKRNHLNTPIINYP